MIDKCRACESQVNLYNLFNNPDNLSKKFAMCTSLEVMLDDNLPKSICKECLNELNIAYIFRTKCEQTNYKLTALLNQIETVNIQISKDIDFLYELKEELSKNENDDISSNEDNNDTIENEPVVIDIVNENQLNNDLLDNFLIKNPLICTTCGVEYTNIMLSESLINDNKNDKQIFECIKCNVKSIEDKSKDESKKIKIEHKCNVCGKNFTLLKNLNRHCLNIHKQKKPSVDFISSKSLSPKCTLKLQSCLLSDNKSDNNKKRSSSQLIICQYCGKKSFNMSNHIRHERIHTGETPFECAVCPKKFKIEASLKNHMTLHTGVKSHECGVCNKKFRLKKSLTFHMLVHTGEKPYKCDICGKMCRLRQHLKSHKLTHSGEKKYECGLCGMAFRQMPHLRQHNFTHTGEKPHKCLYCDKAFAMRYNLTVHMRTHTGDTPYQCLICSKKFNDSKGLKRHKFVHIKSALAIHPTNI